MIALAAGWAHSVAITNQGAVFTWGCGMDGRLGHGSHADQYAPTQVRALAAGSLTVVQAAAGYAHTLFRTDSGAVFGTGANTFGQTGVTMPSSVVALSDLVDGVAMPDGPAEGDGGVDDDQFNAIKIALDFVDGTEDGAGAEGADGSGAGGSRAGGDSILAPLRVEALSPLKVTHISVGDNHSCAMGE